MKILIRFHYFFRVAVGPNDLDEGQNERPLTLAFKEPETSELGPVSRHSISTPVLDENDYSPPKSPVRRTLSEPPESHKGQNSIDFKASMIAIVISL